jgi:hypothetical protein
VISGVVFPGENLDRHPKFKNLANFPVFPVKALKTSF